MEPFIEIGEPLLRYKKPLPLTLTEEVVWLRSTVKESVQHCKDLLFRNGQLESEIQFLTNEVEKVKKQNLTLQNKVLRNPPSQKEESKELQALRNTVGRLESIIKSKDKIINSICGPQFR